MRIGDIKTLRQALGGVVGRSYCFALKRAAGMTGSRYFDIDLVIKWRKNNPHWKMARPAARTRPRGRPPSKTEQG
jgi:hypothetical protein